MMISRITVVLTVLFALLLPVFSMAVTIDQFTVPASDSNLYSVVGPDGNLWIAESGDNKIVRMTADGVITEFAIPAPHSHPMGITSGPDGNIWFTENDGNKIGRITTSGSISQFSIPTGGSHPVGITSGPDGNLWFVESSGNKIGRISASGIITEFSVPTSNSFPYSITSGPDGNLWFVEWNGNKIGKVTTTGSISEFSLPTKGAAPYNIAQGPDGNIWFTEWDGNKIGKITTAGSIVEFALPPAHSKPSNIAAGPESSLWFAQPGVNQIGQITTGGVVNEFDAALSGRSTPGVTLGPTGNLLVTAAGPAAAGAQNAGQVSQVSLTPMNSKSFSDVSSSYWAVDYIGAIYRAGITYGCGRNDYCPSSNVTRAQMAAFVIRAMFGENFGYTQIPYYADVPSSDYFFRYIQKMRDMNVTATTGNYNPNDSVTRDEMAAFLVRAGQSQAGLSTENFSYTRTPYFGDVPSTDLFFKYVQKLKDLGITTVSGSYGGTQNVTRDQMAAFLARTFLGMK
jgi:streptogramin lyase